MTLPRVLLLCVAGIFFADYRYGNARLFDKVSDQTTQFARWLNGELWRLERKVTP
jgi:hypothetical protein